MPNQLDPTVVNLAKAIRQTESGGNFNAKGASGEHGGYQYTPDTWNAVAPRYGIHVPIEQATPEQQNAVTYNRIKAWKDQGHDVTQIASMWNAGEGEPTAYTGRFGSTTATHKAGDPSVGVNRFGAKYDVPTYAKSVSQAYLTIKNGGDVQADPNNPSSTAYPQPQQPTQPQEGGLMDKLGQRASQFGNAMTANDYPGQSVVGGLGAIAGGINDVVGTALSPIIKGASDAISSIPAVQNFAQSSSPQLDSVNSGIKSIGDTYNSFAKEHPKVTQFAEDVGNISSLAPIGEGANIAKDVAVGGTKGLARTVLPSSESIMNRVARLTPTDARKFEALSGETHGNYLQRTGNFGTPEQVIQKEAQKFTQSIQDVDNALASLDGKFKNSHVKTALQDLMAREERIGVSSADTSKIANLLEKSDTEGLTMSEINEVKRLYERNVKLDYQRQNLPEGLERATRIDDSLRQWQFGKAKDLGLKNLPDLNKQTQLSKFIVDKLGKQVTGSTGNHAIGLTDWIILSGLDPSSIAGFFLKKGLTSDKGQARLAKFLAKKPQGQIKPNYGGKTGLPALIKGRDYTPVKGKVKPRALPKSVRETNIGLDEVRNAKIGNKVPQQVLLPRRATAIQLPTSFRNKGK